LPFAKWLLRFTDKGFAMMMTSTNWFVKLLRSFALTFVEFVLKSKRIRPRVFNAIAQIG
jgi:hypothetical protein